MRNTSRKRAPYIVMGGLGKKEMREKHEKKTKPQFISRINEPIKQISATYHKTDINHYVKTKNIHIACHFVRSAGGELNTVHHIRFVSPQKEKERCGDGAREKMGGNTSACGCLLPLSVIKLLALP